MNSNRNNPLAAGLAFVVAACGISVAALAETVTVDDLIGNDEVSIEQAKTCASKWAEDSANFQGALLGGEAKTARVVKASASPSAPNAFHVVQLDGGGFVVVSADSRIEPVIAFSESDDLIEDEDNPLFVLLRKDIPARLEHVAALSSGSANAASAGAPRLMASSVAIPEEIMNAKRAWARLLSDNPESSSPRLMSSGAGSTKTPSDTRVKPLIKSTWSQSYVGSAKVYNYYTPNNYLCGCVATAFAQIMRYHMYPTASLPKRTFKYTVDGVPKEKEISGKFEWNSMPISPTKSITDTQAKAIGKLTYYVGISSYMNYTAGESGTFIGNAADALVNYFGWSSGFTYAYMDAGNYIEDAILANLDNAKPVGLGIFEYYGGLDNGHCIIADGYGYNGATLYTHLNIGWGGKNDAWYQLPNVSAGAYNWNALVQISYNLFPKDKGEIISGRTLDPDGKVISSAEVVACDATGTVVARGKSGKEGIYSLIVPSAQDRFSTVNYNIKATAGTKSGQRSVRVGKSTNSSIGNRWGQDITCAKGLTVTFDANDESGATRTQAFQQGVSQALALNEFVREGYIFKGWAKTQNGMVAWQNGQAVTVSSDITVYAVWEALPPCVVTFNSNDGTGATRSQEFISGVKQALDNNSFIRIGYEFVGWAVRAKGDAVYSDGQAVAFSSDRTLYAVWQPDSRVQFTIVGGVLTEVELNGAPYVLIPNTVKKIGRGAFKDTAGLELVAIPDGVIEIEEEAVAVCANLRHLSLPESVTRIE